MFDDLPDEIDGVSLTDQHIGYALPGQGLDNVSEHREDDMFTPGACKPILGCLITLDAKYDGDLSDAVTQLNKECQDPVTGELWAEQFETFIENWVSLEFLLGTPTQEDMNCIAYAMLDLLEPYKKLTCFDVIENALDVYILPSGFVPDSAVLRLTGIELVEA